MYTVPVMFFWVGNARDAQVPDPGVLLHQPAGVPDRVHGGLHAVHQHCSPFGRGENIISFGI